MIESAPTIYECNTQQAISLLTNPDYSVVFKKIDDEYLYWDKIKYLTPKNVKPEIFWHSVKLKRSINATEIRFGKLVFHFTITARMQHLLHEFDMNFGGSLNSNSIIPEKDHRTYLVNSIMEEAIASSQMEGASTTRKIAKDMLRKQAKPVNKSQQMIANNYSTIQYLVEHKNEQLDIDGLLNVHHLITNKTLDNSADEGAFRTYDNVHVMNNISGEIVHTPPLVTELTELVNALCHFANNTNDELFIHPIIKGIIIHFMLAYFHPFVDGNGRTSRSLVYWYLLKKGYWLTEYLSISRVIYKNKSQYEKSFLYTEQDNLDLSYFINYHLTAMKKSYEDLKSYLQTKIKEQQDFYTFRGFRDINERQAQILKLFNDKPQILLTSKELTTRFPITIKTARSDLQHLVQLGLLEETPINKRLKGYIKNRNFDNILKSITNQ